MVDHHILQYFEFIFNSGSSWKLDWDTNQNASKYHKITQVFRWMDPESHHKLIWHFVGCFFVGQAKQRTEDPLALFVVLQKDPGLRDLGSCSKVAICSNEPSIQEVNRSQVLFTAQSITLIPFLPQDLDWPTGVWDLNLIQPVGFPMGCFLHRTLNHFHISGHFETIVLLNTIFKDIQCFRKIDHPSGEQSMMDRDQSVCGATELFGDQRPVFLYS